MQRNHSTIPWCRYADDGLAHCKTEQQALQLLEELKQRFKECGLELHPDKTKIVYCKDNRRRGSYSNKSFDFLGYTFRARVCESKQQKNIFVGFTPAVSKAAMKSMRAKVKKDKVYKRGDMSLVQIAQWYNPILQGWLNYYGCYTRSAMSPVFWHFNKTLVQWARRKHLKLKKHKVKAVKFLERIVKKNPWLFVHWRKGMIGAFA